MFLPVLLSILFCPSVLSFSFFHLTPTFRRFEHSDLNYFFRELLSHCEHKIAPWSKHPWGIVQANKFQQAYNAWVHRVYSAQPVDLGQDGWIHSYHTDFKCDKRSLKPHQGSLLNELPDMVTMLQAYALKEHSICVRAAQLLAHSIHLQAHETFNVTEGEILFNIPIKPHTIPWFHTGFYVQLYSASAFATLVAPLTLTVVLAIRHPRLFAFFFR
ncbi:ORF2a' protein [DeBrazza's monkey arterivirus]|uniref:ORF2a' protein n=1 Tax=DeBrazza's monkey arterivirus TaxID=1965063 RepID=A0A0B6CFI5_9NIDO|nr:ORF2a' protein [DeBrazza's monkey arterivirus]AJI43726.1 ORF2a' protein [DeBrazza's monkey arterivirus]